jgi:hypothetical protein
MEQSRGPRLQLEWRVVRRRAAACGAPAGRPSRMEGRSRRLNACSQSNIKLNPTIKTLWSCCGCLYFAGHANLPLLTHLAIGPATVPGPHTHLACSWYNQLCPGVKRTPFSEWEQAVIIKVSHVANPVWQCCALQAS